VNKLYLDVKIYLCTLIFICIFTAICKMIFKSSFYWLYKQIDRFRK